MKEIIALVITGSIHRAISLGLAVAGWQHGKLTLWTQAAEEPQCSILYKTSVHIDRPHWPDTSSV